MDDGGQDPGFILNTQSFTKEEVELLIKVLDEKFGLRGKTKEIRTICNIFILKVK